MRAGKGEGSACATSRGRQPSGQGQDTRTSRSSVKVDFLGESFMVADMSTRSRDASLLNSASKVVMKGLRDIGLLLELERLVALAGEGNPGEGYPGEAALRKGLLEERLSCKPGEGRRSVDKRGRSATRPSWSGPKGRVKQAFEGGRYLALTALQT